MSVLTKWLVWGCVLISPFAFSQGRLFALVSKNTEDQNFVLAWQGCQQEADKYGDTCLHVGHAGSAHFRMQDAALKQALDRPLAGVAISVTHSEFLARRSLAAVLDRGIPLITFDSDLEPEYQSLRLAYVGADNQSFGRDLGRLARSMNPNGGKVCLMSGEADSPNLNDRMTGVRRALSGNPLFASGKKLSGEGGWSEPPRCPWYNWDKQKRALAQLQDTLRDANTDLVLSVGSWPQFDLDRYQAVVAPLKDTYLTKQGKRIIIGIGTPNERQLDFLHQGLVNGYVAIDFESIGKRTYQVMKSLAEGQPVAKVTYVKNRVYRYKAESN